ncbi:MAG: zf-HC2 domain-containing protein [Lachnospiraceae bacterium]|nr:zf-HC2 domain-containing protein [Lachnospiraceae bacterium]
MMMEQNEIRECEIVQDLLPLYHDEACSGSSRKYVEAHISACAECQAMLERLENHTVEDMVTIETKEVLKRHEEREKTAAYKAGLVISGLLMLPVVIMLIVVMAGGASLGVFSVLLASMLLVGALTAVPLLASENRFAKLIVCSLMALLLILFFVDRMNGGGEFLYWAVPTIFGLSVVFFPFVIRAVRLPVALANQKALLTIAWDTLWLYLTILEVCIHNGNYAGLKTGMIAATIMIPWVWLILIFARYLPVNRWIKGGLILIVSGIWMGVAQNADRFGTEHCLQSVIQAVDLTNWHTDGSVNANVSLISFLTGLILGGICLVIGRIRSQKKRTEGHETNER